MSSTKAKTKISTKARTRLRAVGIGVLASPAVIFLTAGPAAAAWYDYLPGTRGFSCRWFGLC